MEPERLESLLRQAVMRGPTAPLTPECLDIHTILALLDRPADVRQEDLEHLTACRYCQRAVALARRDREILDAPWSEESEDAVAAAPADAGVSGLEEPSAARMPPTKRSWWFGGLPAWAGMAAVLVAAVGVGWWLTQERELLGPIAGEFQWVGVTRADEQPELRYNVTVELKSAAHLTWLYLDHTRQLQLPPDAAEQVEKFPAGPRPFDVTVTSDPPGPQWIAAVASEESFNPPALRDELQAMIDALPDEASFDELIERLEQALRDRPDLSFRAHGFQVPAPNSP